MQSPQSKLQLPLTPTDAAGIPCSLGADVDSPAITAQPRSAAEPDGAIGAADITPEPAEWLGVQEACDGYMRRLHERTAAHAGMTDVSSPVRAETAANRYGPTRVCTCMHPYAFFRACAYGIRPRAHACMATYICAASGALFVCACA